MRLLGRVEMIAVVRTRSKRGDREILRIPRSRRPDRWNRPTARAEIPDRRHRGSAIVAGQRTERMFGTYRTR